MQKTISIFSIGTEIVVLRQNYVTVCYAGRIGKETCQFTKGQLSEYMCSTDLCLFSTQPNYISKNRDKGHRKGWVEVSMDKEKKAKVPSTEISIGSTPNSRINRSVVAFWDPLYPGSIGKRTKSDLLLHWIGFAWQDFWGGEGCRDGLCEKRTGVAPYI